MKTIHRLVLSVALCAVSFWAFEGWAEAGGRYNGGGDRYWQNSGGHSGGGNHAGRQVEQHRVVPNKQQGSSKSGYGGNTSSGGNHNYTYDQRNSGSGHQSYSHNRGGGDFAYGHRYKSEDADGNTPQHVEKQSYDRNGSHYNRSYDGKNSHHNPPVYKNNSHYYNRPVENHYYHKDTNVYVHPHTGYRTGVFVSAAWVPRYYYTPLWIGGVSYYYYDGDYYLPRTGGYVSVEAPVGAFITTLPVGFVRVHIGGRPHYYCKGTYYAPYRNGFVVVNPPARCTAVGAGPFYFQECEAY